MNRLSIIKRYLSTSLLTLLVAGWMMGCTSSARTADGGLDTQEVIADLRATGLVISPRGPALQSFFTETGEEFSVASGGTLQVYEYDSTTEAESNVDRINLSQVDATSSPHFYHKGNVIVVYFGNQPEVEHALTSSLGSQVL